MKIVCPIDNKNEVEVLISGGVDEFYCGYISKDWLNEYSAVCSPNRREWFDCNFNSLDDLKEVVDLCKKHKKPINLCLNSANISDNQYPLLIEELKQIKKLDFDSIIVSDIGLMVVLNKLGFEKIHLSCGTAILNSQSIDFFKNMNIKRIILPRQVTLKEFSSLREKNKDIELESFVLNDACKNLDGFCTFMHGFNKNYCGETVACNLPYEIGVYSVEKDIRKIRTASRKIKERIFSKKTTCGVCALYDFINVGMDAVKIAGRGKPMDKKIKDVIFVKKLMGEVEKSKNKSDFIKKARELYTETYNRLCSPEACYYEVD